MTKHVVKVPFAGHIVFEIESDNPPEFSTSSLSGEPTPFEDEVIAEAWERAGALFDVAADVDEFDWQVLVRTGEGNVTYIDCNEAEVLESGV